MRFETLLDGAQPLSTGECVPQHHKKTVHERLKKHDIEPKALTRAPNSPHPNSIKHLQNAREQARTLEAPPCNTQFPKGSPMCHFQTSLEVSCQEMFWWQECDLHNIKGELTAFYNLDLSSCIKYDHTHTTLVSFGHLDQCVSI